MSIEDVSDETSGFPRWQTTESPCSSDDDEQRDWWTPPAKLGTPKAFDLITDPKEEYTATATRNTWNAELAMKIVVEFEQSLKQHPPIHPGTPDPYMPER